MVQKYRNIHTGKVVALSGTELVKDYQKSVLVYILDDGQRWNEDYFTKNWAALDGDPEPNAGSAPADGF